MAFAGAGPLTLMYTDVPTKVFATELMSSPETPKSQSLICPAELKRIFDGLISYGKRLVLGGGMRILHTSVNNSVDVVEVGQPLQD